MASHIQSKSSKEKRQHGTAFVPYGYYECLLPDPVINVPMHWHPEFELNYVVEGMGEFLFDDERYLLSKGDILLLPPDTLHAVYPVESDTLIYDAFVFHPGLLGTASNDRCTAEYIRPILTGDIRICNPLLHNLPDLQDLQCCARQIMKCAKMNTSQHDLLLKSELFRFFWLLDNGQKLTKKESSTSYTSLIRPALQYIQTHFSEEIRIDQLATKLHLSKSYFMACFKKAVGISAIEYLTQYRINYACEKLRSTTQSISEIALQSGYTNLSNFNRHFKTMVGQTPNEYRRHRALPASTFFPQNKNT